VNLLKREEQNVIDISRSFQKGKYRNIDNFCCESESAIQMK
jgi:hypothetical protein